ADLRVEAVLEARRIAVLLLWLLLRRGRHYRSSTSPQPSRLQTRTLTRRPSSPSRTSWTPRGARPHVGQTIITFETASGEARSNTPPGWTWVWPMRLESFIGRGLRWRLTRFRFSTITRRLTGSASRTRPCLPRSLPDST